MSLQLKVIQPNRTVKDTECEHVIVPGVDGDFGISAEHTPFITKLRPGTLTVFYDNQKKKKDTLAVHDGFVTVENNTIRIVSEIVEKSNEIELSRAEKAKKRAEERMAAEESDIDYRRAESALKRAITRIQAVSEQ